MVKEKVSKNLLIFVISLYLILLVIVSIEKDRVIFSILIGLFILIVIIFTGANG